MRRLLEFELENGETVLVEVEEPEIGGLVPAARPGEVVARAHETFEKALGKVRPTASAIIRQLRTLHDKPDEIEVEFGVKLSAEAGAVLAAAGAEANIGVKLIWKSDKE